MCAAAIEPSSSLQVIRPVRSVDADSTLRGFVSPHEWTANVKSQRPRRHSTANIRAHNDGSNGRRNLDLTNLNRDVPIRFTDSQNPVRIFRMQGCGRFAVERNMHRLLFRILRDESGATAIEYSLIAAGIALVIVAAVNGIGTILNGTFTSVQTGLK